MSLFLAGCLKWSVIKELSLEIIYYSLQRVISFSYRWLLLLVRAEPPCCCLLFSCDIPKSNRKLAVNTSQSWRKSQQAGKGHVCQNWWSFLRKKAVKPPGHTGSVKGFRGCYKRSLASPTLRRCSEVYFTLFDRLMAPCWVTQLTTLFGSFFSRSFSVECNILFSPVVIARWLLTLLRFPVPLTSQVVT